MLTSIVILQHETWQLTRDLVDSIAKYTEAPYELVIVDNGSSDRLAVQYLERLDASTATVKLVLHEYNQGFAKAVNHALTLCEGEYILLLNNDCQITHPDWLTMLVDALEADDQVGIVSALTTAPDQSVYWQRWDQYRQLEVIDVALHGLPMVPMTCVLLPADVVDVVGNLCEDFFVYGEDDDYCMRLRQHGLKLAVHTGVLVRHLHKQTTKLLKIDLERYKAKARELLTDKYGTAWLHSETLL